MNCPRCGSIEITVDAGVAQCSKCTHTWPVDTSVAEIDVDEVLAKHHEIRDRVSEEILTELWAAIPWGRSFRLSDGSEATITEMNNRTGASRPKRNDDGEMSVIFDAKIKGGRLDHIELQLRVSGSGGMVL